LIIKEKLKHHKRSFEIRVIKFVENVPAEGTKLTSFLNNGVEEGQTKDKLAPLLRFLAVVEVLVRHFSETSLKIGFDTTRRLSSQFDTVLEHRNREVRSGHRGEEQSEVRVEICTFLEVVDNCFKLWHPSLGQVTVL
jgi:hypothetical protein